MSTQRPMMQSHERAPESVQGRPVIAPPVDIYENPEEILLYADLPGVPEERLTVRLEKDQLSIEGRPAREDSGTLLAGSKKHADYRREFIVPKGIDAEKIEATIRQGVLRVRLPKLAAIKPRQIEVKAR